MELGKRALYWSVYMSEEILDDSDGYTVASGCQGSRTGVRGQQNRCNILEFLLHIKDQPSVKPELLGDVTIADRSRNWAHAVVFNDQLRKPDWGALNELDDKPVGDRIKWLVDSIKDALIRAIKVFHTEPEGDADKARWLARNPPGQQPIYPIPELNPHGKLIKIQTKSPADLLTKTVKPQALAGALPGGVAWDNNHSYEQLIDRMPAIQAKLNQRIDNFVPKTAAEEAQKKLLISWKETASAAMHAIVQIRQADLDRCRVEPCPGSKPLQEFKDFFDGEIIKVKKPYPYGSGVYEVNVLNYPDTIEAAVKSGKYENQEDAIKALEAAITKYNAQEFVITSKNKPDKITHPVLGHEAVVIRWKNGGAQLGCKFDD
ncbi:uncharacterized protein B0I36DRAFT_368013 [Microdochium trichocladiopsis]|uniref:Uncharacterized protein n=1 Tax=Microdochium trichocladiopsis TaxID=1682393 RepID=A0A9P8XU54_9PEZI|nr:uncharacterized protein B0I36DRAFT_368013 [Microdochium trichocladiopsis]KAH7017950.1 hypothetical protein B0I36DRAFT_368013 [Microdochium trichocladiopsis]